MQGLQQKPDVDVRISDVMRALFHGRVHVNVDAEALFKSPLPQAALETDGWRDIVLRCDGIRPVRFTGLPLISLTQNSVRGGRLSLELYTGNDGLLYAHCRISPSPAIAARDMMIGKQIGNIEAMSDFLDACAPDTCVRPHPGADLRRVHQQGEAAALLQRSYTELIATFLPQVRNQLQRSNTCP